MAWWRSLTSKFWSQTYILTSLTWIHIKLHPSNVKASRHLCIPKAGLSAILLYLIPPHNKFVIQYIQM